MPTVARQASLSGTAVDTTSDPQPAPSAPAPLNRAAGTAKAVPHPIPYQGSKRSLAQNILELVPHGVPRLVEPFAGSAAVSLAALYYGKAPRVLFNDVNAPLMDVWKEVVERPEALAAEYEMHWHAQLGREREYYVQIRDEFNRTHRPALLLHLLARCVKGAVRYNAHGEFNQSPDNRRKGTSPDRMRSSIQAASRLLAGRTEITSGDYREVLKRANTADVVYMDPPYQGVSEKRDQRYLQPLAFEEFADVLAGLNDRKLSYILSYDGRTGGKAYGKPLPVALGLQKIEIDAGPSSQATLLGRNERTIEYLFVSPALQQRLGRVTVIA